LRGRDVDALPTTRKVVALTFDAGASADGVASIVATLRREKVPATFFLTGTFVRAHPSTARAITAAYPVGNHTEHHRDLTALSRSAAVDEVRAGRRTILATTGAETRPLFRFPFGARDARTLDLVNDECYVAYRWTVDTLGWKGTSGGATAGTVHDRVLAALRPGEIVLMHVGANPDDGSTLDAAALPRVIASIRARGYGFTTLPR
jgi:peptidoglycan/xylan/chitin deacetylase (PgdA/CDA1 family)